MAMPNLTVLDAIQDRHIFGPWFKPRGLFTKAQTWGAWLVALKALFALPMDADELPLYEQCTGRKQPPTAPASAAWLIVGRRGGKSFITALVGVYLACFRDYSAHLAPGERATIMILASDRKQARVIFRYVKALLTEVPMLRRMIVSDTAESIDLNNRVTIEIHTATIRSVRGYTLAAVLCDEIAHWRSDESANPDREIINAILPGMATIPGSMLIAISSPYARRGMMYEAFRDRYGHEGDDVLVWKADTRTMNPTVSQKIIDKAYAEDPQAAAAEYGAEFRSDVAAFLQEEWLTAAIMQGRHELPPRPGVRYHAFLDPSGGGQDAFTIGIAHNEGGTAVLDVCRGRHGSPEATVKEYADLLKQYGITQARGDRYAAGWTVDAFRRQGITYLHSELSKSEVYLEILPMLSTCNVKLLDDPRLLTELRQLERRTSSGGKDTRAWYPTKRRQTIIRIQDLPAWFKAVQALRDEESIPLAPTLSDYLQVLLLTGLRRSEGVRMRWQDVDLVARTLTIPQTKNGEPLILPLSGYLVDLLKAREEAATTPYVFPGEGREPGPLVEPRAGVRWVVQQSGIEFSLHDLRRTFITVAESLEISSYAVKRLVNHKMGRDVTAGYIISDVERLRAPMQRISDEMLRKGKVLDEDNVIAFPAAQSAG